MSVQDIYQIRTQMKNLHKKYNLLYKKQNSFGLTDIEEKKMKELRSELWTLREELIETHLNTTVFSYLLDKNIVAALKEIQDLIPWSGELIVRDEELRLVVEAEKRLSKEERELIYRRLEYIHKMLLQNFQDFCSTEAGYNYMYEVSKVLTDSEGDVVEVIVYIDARYREFGELLGIHLEEVEIIFDEGEDNE